MIGSSKSLILIFFCMGLLEEMLSGFSWEGFEEAVEV